jgi:hypothetical protein
VHLKSGEKDFSSPFTDWYIFEKKWQGPHKLCGPCCLPPSSRSRPSSPLAISFLAARLPLL